MENRKKLSFIDALTSQIHGTMFRVGGSDAIGENLILIRQFYVAWLYLAKDVLSQCDLFPTSLDTRLCNFAHSLCETDVQVVLTVCQDAADILIDNRVLTYGDFKDCLMKAHPASTKVLPGLLAPVSLLLASLFECPDVKPVSLQLVLPFLRYGKKLSLQAIGLEEKAIAAYLETESMLSAISLEKDQELIQGLNSIMRCWLRELDLTDLVPQHGSGAVAEGKLTIFEKYNELGTDIYLKVVLGESLSTYYPKFTGKEVVRVSRTVFVPKTFSKLRTISMEPTTLQYFQQGVMKRLYNYIEFHPYLGRRIKLRDQTQNQEMAREGSISNSLSTIDLSAASDTVSWALVKAVFARTPLLKWLYVTRSKKTKLPDGKIILMKKFAPMGSALCFPVECLVFAAVIEYVTQRWCMTSKQAKPDYSVFGDDLIVHNDITTEVIEALSSLGFIVNKSKTFVSGPFRESCGKDYYDGIDVSSVYYRLPAYDVRRLSPEVYAAVCSAANLAAEKGLRHLRQFLLSIILPRNPYFTNTTSESPAVYSPCPTNFHVKRKWNDDYQLWLGRFCSVLSRPIQVELYESDDIAYFVKLAQMAERSNDTLQHLAEPPVGVTLHGTLLRLGVVLKEVSEDSNTR